MAGSGRDGLAPAAARRIALTGLGPTGTGGLARGARARADAQTLVLQVMIGEIR